MDDVTQAGGSRASGLDATNTGCLCLCLLACFNQMVADAQALEHQFGRVGQAFGSTDIIRSADYLKLKARLVRAEPDDLAKIRLPAIARHRDDHYLIIAQYQSGPRQCSQG